MCFSTSEASFKCNKFRMFVLFTHIHTYAIICLYSMCNVYDYRLCLSQLVPFSTYDLRRFFRPAFPFAHQLNEQNCPSTGKGTGRGSLSLDGFRRIFVVKLIAVSISYRTQGFFGCRVHGRSARKKHVALFTSV